MMGEFLHGGPVLDCCFHDDSSGFSASADNTVRRYVFSSGKEDILGRHDAPVRCIEYSYAAGQVITGSWDKTVKCWDPRGASGKERTLVGTYPQPERVYSISLVGNRLVVATAGRHVNVYDLRNMSQLEQRRESSLKYQARCVRCYPNGTVKDPDTAFFKKLDGFQPCEISELKAGTHVFSIYGDNFFKSASYTIEVLCAAPFPEEKEKLRAVEAQILTKRVELSKFERVLAQFTKMTSRYAQEMQAFDELLKQRNAIHASYSTTPPLKRSSSGSKSRGSFKERKTEELPASQTNRKKYWTKDRLKKKK